MKVICIRDEGRPNEIPLSKWIEKGKIYTVIRATPLPMNPSVIGYRLEEIDLTGCDPYTCFDSRRFGTIEHVPSREITEEQLEHTY